MRYHYKDMPSSFRQALKKALTDNRADAFLVFNQEGSGQPITRYLTGFTGSFSICVVNQKQQILLTAALYQEQAQRQAPNWEVRVIKDRSLNQALSSIFSNTKSKQVLIDSQITSFGQALLINKIPRLQIKSAPGLSQQLRIPKTESELRLLKKAASISHKSFRQLLPHIKPGASEQSIAARLEWLLKENGADGSAFSPIIASGKNSALPHAEPNTKKIKSGEPIVIDFGARYQGYNADISRTICLGQAPTKIQEIYDIVRTAQAKGVAKAKAGMTGKELDSVCRDYITAKGYGDSFVHSTGHGLGLEVHELPTVTPSNNNPLPENSVVTIEPGIYLPGLGGVRIEDAVVLNKNGCYNLNQRLPRTL